MSKQTSIRIVFYTYFACALMGCMEVSPPEPTTGPTSPWVLPNTINLNRSMAIVLDPCMRPYMASWNKAVAIFATYGVTIYTDKPSVFTVTCSDGPLEGAKWIALTSFLHGTVILTAWYDQATVDEQAHVWVHEILHAFGAAHVLTTNSILYPSVGATIALTEDDVNAFEEHLYEDGLAY